MHRRDLTDALGPIPMWQDMGHGKVRPPTRLVNVKTILLEAGQVDDAEIGTSRRHSDLARLLQLLGPARLVRGVGKVQQGLRVAAVRSRLAQIVETGPD